MQKKIITILGSTGSIGVSALDVVRRLEPTVTVKALAVKSNIDLLEQQARAFSVDILAVYDEAAAEVLRRRMPQATIYSGMDGICAVATHDESNMVLSAMSGACGILPTMAAICKGKDIALANKEILVAAGEMVMRLARACGVRILPVDSEHSALFQCLEGRDITTVRRLILTASGGPFFRSSLEQLATVTLEQVLAHPTWNMGNKITVDSSTLLNKGLEVIEAHWLFSLPPEQISVVIHPQSIVHSMVEFIDGSILAQISQPDMRLPIQYAFTYPDRMPTTLPFWDIASYCQLDFLPVDVVKFPCLPLAYTALQKGGSTACYMNAVNEVLVERFLESQIHWSQIAEYLVRLVERHTPRRCTTEEEIQEVDRIARSDAMHM